VQVARVDTFKKQVDFQLAVEERKLTPSRSPALQPSAARLQLGRGNKFQLKTSVRSFGGKRRGR